MISLAHRLPANSSSSAPGASEQDRALARHFFDAPFCFGAAASKACLRAIIESRLPLGQLILAALHKYIHLHPPYCKAYQADLNLSSYIYASTPLSPVDLKVQQQPSYMSLMGSYARPMPMGIYPTSPHAIRKQSKFQIRNPRQGKG